MVVVSLPKKRKSKWGQLYRNKSFRESKEGSLQQIPRSSSRRSNVKKLNGVDQSDKRRSHKSNQSNRAKRNERSMFSDFQKTRLEVRKRNCRRHVSVGNNGSRSTSEFEKLSRRYDHLPIFSKSSRKKIREKISCYEEVSELKKEVHIKKRQEDLTSLFFVSKTLHHRHEGSYSHQNIRTKRGRSRKSIDAMETKRFINTESHVSRILTKSKSRTKTKRSLRNNYSRKTASVKNLRRSKMKKDKSPIFKRDQSNPVITNQSYKEVEIKRRRVRINSSKVHTSRGISKTTSRNLRKKRKGKINIPLLKKFDKTESYDTLDQTYGMVRLKADSTLIDFKSKSKSDLHKQSLIEYISKNTDKDSNVLQSLSKQSIIKNGVHKLNFNSQECHNYPSLFTKGKVLRSEFSQNIDRTVSPGSHQIPKFKFFDQNIRPRNNAQKKIDFEKLRKAMPDSSLPGEYQSSMSKLNIVRVQKLIIATLQSALKKEQKQRLSCERELLTMLESNQEVVNNLEKQMEKTRMKYSTPVKILEGMVNSHQKSRVESSIRLKRKVQLSRSKKKVQPSPFECIKNKYKMLLEMD